MLFKKFFLKQKCINCVRNSDKGICLACINQLQRLPELHCQICQSLSLENDQCLECEKRKPLFKKLSSIGIYNGLLKTLIYDYKYQKLKDYAQPLSYVLSESLKTSIPIKEIDIITSIPLHKDKMKSRGFNQAELISRELSVIFKKKHCEVFGRVKNTKPQFSLSLKERKENLEEAFEIIYPAIKNKTVLVVDDIFTTGSTIQECCKIILPYTEKIYIAVLARSIV